MTTPGPSYSEYRKFCEEKGLEAVKYEQFTAQLWLDLCREYGIANAVNDERGLDWETVYRHEPWRRDKFVNCS